jgi:plastocyanin
MRRYVVLAAVVLGVLAIGAGAISAMAATSVSVTAGKPSELRFKLSKSTVSPGTVTFTIKNSGTLAHDFKIAGKRTKLLKRSTSTTLTVTLKKGTYTYLCTVPGHSAGGMKGTLIVR